MKQLAYLFIIISLSSCGPIIKVAMGIKSPKMTTDQEVLNYANKNFEVDAPIYRMKDFTLDSLIPMNVTSFPVVKLVMNNEVKIFDVTCTADYPRLIAAPLDSLGSLESEMSMPAEAIQALFYNCKDEKINNSQQPTFYLFYANFIGKINKQNINPWIAALANRKDVNYVLVNCDPTIEMPSDEKVKVKANR